VNYLFTSNPQLLNLFHNNSKYFFPTGDFLNCLQAPISKHNCLNSNFMFSVFVNNQLLSIFFKNITSCNTNAEEISCEIVKLDSNCISKYSSYGSTSYKLVAFRGKQKLNIIKQYNYPLKKILSNG